ncbi:NUDIX domain-containing protein [Sediminibacterium ginsengisoli]|uniref:GDP-mannose pyrophosphatase n=1 Tax=Sediminibacterium ginsengisoli TaxID=413434 RepID=A0A1T4L7T3_9BACT|nr:NUDIX hydrolase [Sediminibacterium ginsengisoli]SJZ50775.1 8-oxo-dGTP pyrophosphatase MutT, NUDIX family [Sediminibacterium ginsengisoli]
MQEQNPWTILQEKPVYDNPWISLTEYDVINPGGGKGIYGKVHFKNTAVAVLPVDADLNTFLVGQYRFTLDAYSWEIPAGGCLHEPGKPVSQDICLAAAQRELLEETGLVASHWQLILTMHLSNSVSDELAYVYLAKGLVQQEAAPEETEQLVIRKLPFGEAFSMVEKGQITDSMSVAGILKLRLMQAEGRL